MIISFFTLFIIIIIDQIFKAWIVAHLSLGQSMSFLPGIMDFYYVQNKGAGWSLFQGQMTFFMLATLLVCIYFIYLVYKHRKGPWYLRISYGLLLGGALGNLIDRLRLGYVVDMFRTLFIEFPIFNIADAALTLAVISLLIIQLFSKEELDVL
ncbi:signal peptidase II [Eremococcus coleocola]|uniref:signal peptidase II n=1 Tax=Eremococcus coleocola TaxID=88132 RepID=UPI0004197497|nr:signal peptidase II [Eremococcus coleocola]